MQGSETLPALVIEPPRGRVRLELGELWRARELIGFLALRDLKVRYRQSLLGIAWALLQPLLTLATVAGLLGLLLGRGRLPSAPGLPYALATFAALVPWQIVARGVTAGGESLVAHQALVTKVYLPRLALPLAPVVAALADFAVGLALLVLWAAARGIAPGPALLALPGFLLIALAAAAGAALWLSALNALYRDVRHALPSLLQLWLFASPVFYSASTLLEGRPAWFALLYGINPLACVAEGFRFGLLGGPAPPPALCASGALAAFGLLASGLALFRSLEGRFVDRV
jgi:lipopolysaccharide transport system permease protein